jgi:hypothetical protein
MLNLKFLNMGILKQVSAKNKAMDIIHSCEDIEQCVITERYIGLYYEKFHDLLGFTELTLELKKHEYMLST